MAVRNVSSVVPNAVIRPSIEKRIRKSFPYYLLILLPLIYLLVFKYYPMLGVQIAFKDFKVRGGIWGSPWVGWKHFEMFFGSATAGTIIMNTFVLSLFYLIASFPMPIILAICLNECRSRRFTKFTQMVTYMPYFISTVVLVSMIIQFTDISSGFINQILVALGGSPVNFMGTVDYFRPLYVLTGVWQTMGYSAIVYLAALSGVPVELYEAATVDGASKLRRVFSIDLPYIAPTIITLFILNTGSILSIGFEKIYLMQNSINTPVSEVISTYVYKMGVLNFNYSYSTAVGLFNSLVNLLMLLVVNTLSNRISKVSVL
ncbi:MAG: ABC transporter permease subunit [Christensenellales bacterium]|nr:ABC transporter permease subunit [Christensenellales bacterium]